MAMLYRADGTQEAVTPTRGKKFTLEELQKLVDGYIEGVPTTTGRRMYVNEEGLLLKLPLNLAATELLTPAYRQAGNIIVGNAVLMDKGEE